MSYTDDEIDKLFKEAGLNQKTPVFQDSFFDEVEALLPQKRNKKGIFWFFGIFLTLIIAIGTFVNLNYSKTKTQLAKTNMLLNTNTNESKQNSKINTTKVIKTDQKSPLKKTSNTNDFGGNEQNNNATSYKSKSINDLTIGKFKESQISNKNAVLPMILVDQIAVLKNNQLNIDFINEPSKSVELGKTNLEQNEYSLDQTYGELLANPFPLKTSRLILSTSFASGFSENFITNEGQNEKPVFVNSLGLTLGYKFKKYTLSVGLEYSNYQTHELNLSRSSKVYDFEVNKYDQTIEFKWISTLQAPISIGKEFGNHKVTLGIDPSVVLGSCVDFTKNQNAIKIENERYYANMIGLKRFYLGGHISYDLKLAKDYSFGIKISNQLLNPIDMTKFEGTSNNNAFQAQLTIKKYFKLK